jgi:hypothetical protein
MLESRFISVKKSFSGILMSDVDAITEPNLNRIHSGASAFIFLSNLRKKLQDLKDIVAHNLSIAAGTLTGFRKTAISGNQIDLHSTSATL